MVLIQYFLWQVLLHFGGRASHCAWLCYSLQDLTCLSFAWLTLTPNSNILRTKNIYLSPTFLYPVENFWLILVYWVHNHGFFFFFTNASPKLSTMKAHSANIYWIDSYNVWKFDYSNLLSFPINITVFLICLGSPFLFFIVKVTQTSNSIIKTFSITLKLFL